LRCRELPGDDGLSTDKSQTGCSQFRSSIDIDVVYVDSLTGNTIDDEIGEDESSVSRANSFRHRSLYADPESASFQPQWRDRVSGLPVASVTFRRVRLLDRLAERLADVLLRRRSFRMMTFVQCDRVDECLRRVRRTLVDRKDTADAAGTSRLCRLNVRLSRVDSVGVVAAEMAEVFASSLQVLCLTGCGIMSAGCAAVVRTLVAGSRRLVELDLGFNDVEDVRPLSDALEANCSLRRLRLRGNAIESTAAAALFGSLRRNYRLQVTHC